MDEATREEFGKVYETINGKIDKVHEKLDKYNETTNQLSVNMARVAVQLEQWPKPGPRPCKDLKDHIIKSEAIERPCGQLKAHLAEHKDARQFVGRSVIATVIRCVVSAAVGAAAAVFATKRG